LKRGGLLLWCGSVSMALVPTASSQVTAPQLDVECRSDAARVAKKLGEGCACIVRPPFVIAGNLTEAELERWHAQTISPAAQAMARSYFRTPPDQPITVLLFADEESYRDFARRLYQDERVSIYGYYKPAERVLVMNIGTGGGTLVHELTHALIAFDFPRVPDWFNEGLASLHEQCRIRDDETGIEGLPNWRLPMLIETIQRGKLRSLKSLIDDENFRGGQVGLNYAHARYFCLFMQQRGVLGRFYQRLRESQRDDSRGQAAVEHIFPDHTWEQLDDEFRQWANKLPHR